MNQFLDRKDNTTSHSYTQLYNKILVQIGEKIWLQAVFSCHLKHSSCLCKLLNYPHFGKKNKKPNLYYIYLFLGALKKFKSNFDSFLRKHISFKNIY